MLGFLYRFIIGTFHRHEWETFKIVALTTYNQDKEKIIYAYTHHQRCKVCGALRTKTLYN